MRNPVTVRLQLSAIMAVASLTLSGCFTLVPSSTVDVSIENYGPSPLTVLVREGATVEGRTLASGTVPAAQGDVWHDRYTSFERTAAWTLWVNGAAEFSSDAYDQRGPNVLIVREDHDGTIVVDQQIRL